MHDLATSYGMNTLLLSLLASVASLGYGAFLIWGVLKKSAGDEKMVAIQKAIQEGASAYLKRQNRTVFFVGVVAVLILWKWHQKICSRLVVINNEVRESRKQELKSRKETYST